MSTSLTDRSTPVNSDAGGINPRLALSSRVALPFVRTPDSNEILSENPLAEGIHSGIVLTKVLDVREMQQHSRLRQSIAGWTFLECWLQKHLMLIKPNMVLLILTQTCRFDSTLCKPKTSGSAYFGKLRCNQTRRLSHGWESGWEVGSTRKVPGPKIKTEFLSRLA